MEQSPKPPYECVLFVCCNGRDPGEDACANRGSVELQKKLKEIVKSKGLQNRLRVSRSLCFGLCSVGPNICIMPDNVWYTHVKPEDLPTIIEKHIAPLETPRNE